MDKNSTSGGQNRSSQSHLDFVVYWADKTVEQEILRGHQLREIKPNAFPKREYDVVNIDYIKPPRSMKSGSYRRKRSRESCSNCAYSKGRSSSPFKSEARSHKYRKHNKKKSPCGMRTAELAVPSKRQCLDAWRRNYDKLPAHMIERLRQYVMDQRPVVEIADAIYCFKRKRTVTKEKSERKNTCDKALGRLKKPLKSSDAKTLSAMFGHSIAKKLNTPLTIELNSELEKIANVVSSDIYDLMQKSKKVNMRGKKYKDMHIDVTKKVTIWISDVLEESAYKILEDQCKDFEEEVAPVLDLIDELIDNVVNICEPEPHIIEIDCSESEYSKQGGLEEALIEEDDQAFIATEMIEETIEDHVQNDIIGIIDSIFKDIDIKSDDEMLDTIDIGQIEDTKSDNDIYMDVETETGIQQNEFADANDNFEDNIQTDYINEVIDEQNDDALVEETPESDEDGGGEKNALTGDEPENTEKASEKSSLAHIDFALPNEDLLSDADELWPAENQPPIIRPSESASKSITSLGNIMEDEEKAAQQDEDGNEFQEATNSDDIDGENPEITPDDIDGEKSEITPDDIDGEKPEITPDDIDGEKPEITPDDIDGEKPEITPDHIDGEKPEITTGHIDEEKPEITPDNIDGEKPEITPDNIDGEKLEITSEQAPGETAVALEETAKGLQETSMPEQTDPENTVAKEAKLIEKESSKTSKKGSLLKEHKSSKEKTSPERKSVTTVSKLAQKLNATPKPTTATIRSEKSSEDKTKNIVKIPRISKTVVKKKSPRKEKSIDSETAGASQSVKDLSEDGRETAKDVQFASLRVKKNIYRVNATTAPSWVARAYGESTCVCIDMDPQPKPSQKYLYKHDGHDNIRRWVHDMEQGYENLKLWNEWIDTTSRTINILQQEIGGIVLSEKCNKKPVNKLLELKTNIDKDATLWRKVRRCTQERLRNYRKIYETQRVRDCSRSLLH